MKQRQVELPPIWEELNDYEAIRKKIEELFREQIYFPLLREIKKPKAALQNSIEDLIEAIVSGRITYYRGSFRGRFSATLSKEIRQMGAQWDPKQGSWRIPQSKLNADLKIAIASSEARFKYASGRIIKRLQEMIPAEIAEKLDIENLFDATLWKTEKKFQQSVKNITVAPQLTDEQRARIAAEYTKNMQLYIQDFTQKEIEKLRQQVGERAYAGQRYEGLIQTIKESYGVSQNKAQFLARQETSLMMTKYKQTRYQDAGVNKYKWKCVNMPKQGVNQAYRKGMVRHDHAIHDGKTFTWDNPPIVNDKGDRKNPGQDYGCRCTAIPIVVF